MGTKYKPPKDDPYMTQMDEIILGRSAKNEYGSPAQGRRSKNSREKISVFHHIVSPFFRGVGVVLMVVIVLVLVLKLF